MTRGTHTTLEQAPGIGDAIGRYRIIGVLGDGRLGPLYLAEQHGIRGISKIVALRCIRPELAQRPHFRARFFDAARVAARCEHPNVASIFEMADVEGRYFVSMEYLPGENVAAILAKYSHADLPSDIAAYVVKQVAGAVQYLHDLPEPSPQRVSIRHGDVEPSDVFVTDHGTIKWLGIDLRSLASGPVSSPASERSSRARALQTSTSFQEGADRHVDVLGLGALLWTCLTGEKPLPGAASGAGTPAVGPRSVRPDVPEALDAIARRALCPDPSERFQSAYELSDALDRYLFRRISRPTPKHMRRWLEQSFGAERASLQLQIARGLDAERAFSLLATPSRGGAASEAARAFASPRPRELWSTSHAVFSQLSRASIAPYRSFEPGSVPDERSAVSSIVTRPVSSTFVPAPSLASPELPSLATSSDPQPRSWLAGTLVALGAAVALGAGLISLWSLERSPVRDAPQSSDWAARGGVEVRSTPEGAAVFVDGEPTGLRTPVVLKGLAAGRAIRVRVDKAGFSSEEREVEIVAGSVVTRVFDLVASDGRVRFVGAPGDARIYVDEVPVTVDGESQVTLSIGPHAVRIETANALIFSGRVVVAPGEQAIRVAGDRTAPRE
jgi:eukaryotic-like serine/threonine-protein kinase